MLPPNWSLVPVILTVEPTPPKFRRVHQLLRTCVARVDRHDLSRGRGFRGSSRGFVMLCVLTLAWVLCGCAGDASLSRGTSRDVSKLVVMRFEIKGMHCNGCAGGVRSELLQVPGVFSAKVRYPEADAVVQVDPARVDSTRLIQVIEEAGYRAVGVP